jgi:hypothetical protein
MPPEDSPLERTFLSLNTVLAIIFFLELCVSVFARSDNLYRDFWKDFGEQRPHTSMINVACWQPPSDSLAGREP